MSTVFILEDTNIMKYLYNHHFGLQEIEIKFFTNPIDFLRACSVESPDAVVLDYNLNHQYNGNDVAKAIRKKSSNIPIFMVSGNLTSEVIHKMVEFNIAKFYDKPVDMDNLVSNVQLSIKGSFDTRLDATDDLNTYAKNITNNMKHKVVVLDDVKAMCVMYKHGLKGNFEVETSNTFTEFKTLLRGGNVSVIIIDYFLPDVNFDDILHYLKEEYPDVKKILISGHVETMELNKKYKDDFVRIFSKPLESISDLKDYINTLM